MKKGQRGKRAGLIGLVAVAVVLTAASSQTDRHVTLSPTDTEKEVLLKAVQVRPSQRQMAWQRREFTLFAHFGINTFTGKEWGNGKEDPAVFNPTAFDAGQWAKTAKAAGMSVIILTAKHHDGFCLWPTEYTEHSVKNSPWRGGKGDVVREVSKACKREGLGFGIYLSPWDRHEPTFGTQAYNDYYKNQLRELLINYGEIVEVWMDGACAGDGCEKMRDLYDWEEIFALVRELQPDAVISISGPDVRWVGNEAGKNRESEWSVLTGTFIEHGDMTDEDLGSRKRLMEARENSAPLVWYPSQVDVSIRPGWFYHGYEDLFVRPVRNLLKIYYDSVGGNSQLLLNVPPDRRGLFAERDVKRLKRLGKVLRETFDEDLAEGARATASAVRDGDDKYSPMNTLENDPSTWWMTDDWETGAEIEYVLDGEKTFNVIMVQEAIAERGQRIEEFCVDAHVSGRWVEIGCATTVGYKKLMKIEDVTSDRVRLRVTKSRVCPTVSRFGLFYQPAICKVRLVP